MPRAQTQGRQKITRRERQNSRAAAADDEATRHTRTPDAETERERLRGHADWPAVGATETAKLGSPLRRRRRRRPVVLICRPAPSHRPGGRHRTDDDDDDDVTVGRSPAPQWCHGRRYEITGAERCRQHRCTSPPTQPIK